MSFLGNFKIFKPFYPNSESDYQIKPIHHIVFWFVYFLFNTLRWGSYYNDYLFSLKNNLLGFPIHIMLSYFTIYFLIPRFVYPRKFLKFGFFLLLAIFVMVLLKFELTFQLISHNVWREGPETSDFTLDYAIVMMLGEFYVITFAAAIKITTDWLRETKRATRLKKEQLETELRFLRSQISPHFFFNTLNNIYALSLENSEKTPGIILKLSELMSYLLYGTSMKLQDLEKEVKCIVNYLDLEKLRHDDKLKIKLNISGEIQGKKIPPMLLIPFVENAFKHGAKKNNGYVLIELDFTVKDDFLYFKITNDLPQKTISKFNSDASGIGLANVKKRLKLGYSEDEYHLEYGEQENRYCVDLKLKLG
jgi:sensor histidine kinase YesM